MDQFDRRQFLEASAAALAGLVSSGFQGEEHGLFGSAWPPNATEYRFHMIANSHVDAMWLWPWEEGMSTVMSTFRSVLDRMKENPEFTYTASAAQYYQWVAEIDPKMLDEIRQRVDEGRWCLVGGWWIEPDVNMPNGESLIRQGLYGQRVFKRLFGRTVQVGYNPDSFGHPATLPQILKLQRMNAYVFWRPHPEDKTLPADLFWWEAPDNTRVLTFRILYSYADWGEVATRLKKIIETKKEPTTDLMDFFGAGDHGGAATQENLESIRQVQQQKGAPTLIFSTPERYFEEIRKKQVQAPVIQDDMQHAFIGCYTAMSLVKKLNRDAELLLMGSEKLSALASVVAGYDYPGESFAQAWQKVLLMQFHDSLSGTARPEHYVNARNAYGQAMEVASYSLYRAAEKIAWQVPAVDPESSYLVVFNPHAWPATLVVEYDLEWKPAEPSILEDADKKIVTHQWTQASVVDTWVWIPDVGERNKLVFQASLPAFGYQQFRLRHGQAEAQNQSAVHADQRGMENEHLRVTFLDDGSIDIFDKGTGHQVFREGMGGQRGIIVDDPTDTWGNGVNAYDKEIGTFNGARFRVLENGPLRARVRVYTTYGISSLTTDWLLYRGARSVEARVALDWHEHLKMLKFSYPIDVQETVAVYEIPYGHISRKTDGLENPGQRWLDVRGKKGEETYGLATINDAKYGYSVRDSDLRISVVRGVVYAWEEPQVGKLKPGIEYQWQDQGLQTFRILLLPHAGNWQNAAMARAAEEFTTIVPVISQGIHSGSRPEAASYLSVDVPNVVVSVVKKVEGRDDLIIRCYETAGQATAATLNVVFAKQRWTGKFRSSEIKTLLVPSSGGEITEVDALEDM